MPVENSIRIIKENGVNEWEKLPKHIHDDDAVGKHKQAVINIFALSRFIAAQSQHRPNSLKQILENNWHKQPPTDCVNERLKTQLATIDSESELMKALRHFRHTEMMAIAWRDLTNVQTIQASLTQVSALADSLILRAYDWLYDKLSLRHGRPMGNEGPLPMLILGMGKLGGKELNFSSDIDLIFAYPEKGNTDHCRKPIENQQFFTKLAQSLIAALNRVTAEGQVFRVDMRLRPFGESGPLTMHFGAMEDYYQEQGRHWERFAMVKARILNPQNTYSLELENILTPFTFRRYLDFTTVDALRDMKSMIETETRRRKLENNIKLGTGGIREVEFFAQSFQLIHGGRETRLQQKGLAVTFDVLLSLELIEKPTQKELLESYFFLRKVEQTLQQWNDQQTQNLPDETRDTYQCFVLSVVCGFENYEDFILALHNAMSNVHSHFSKLIADTNQTHNQDNSLFMLCQDGWHLSLTEHEFIDMFDNQLAVETCSTLFAIINNFKQKLRKFRLGQRGQDTLDKLLPEVIYTALESQFDGLEKVLPRVLGVVNAITGRTTYLDLLLENPAVLQQLFKLCGKSEWIAEQIQRFPLLLDELLQPAYLKTQTTQLIEIQKEFAGELRQASLRVEPDDIEMLMDTWRQFKLAQQLRIAAADITGSLPIAKVSDKLTILAEVILETVLQSAWQFCENKFGKPNHLRERETGFAIIGYGKLGGIELGYGSDLDLVFVHNAPRQATTDGIKSISAQQFYIKLSQRIMHLLSAKTLFGQLYETDLRLRPSGNAGLLCCHIDGFRTYQEKEAWTWEHQALVRARCIIADKALRDAFDATRRHVLSVNRNQTVLLNDVLAMRKKMREHLLKAGSGVDLKQCQGGITDIEFITQYWVLNDSHAHPTLLNCTDNLRIIDAAQAASLISPAMAHTLQEAYLTLRNSYHQLTLAEQKFAEDTEVLRSLRQGVTQVWNTIMQSE